jgi:esterase/lipase
MKAALLIHGFLSDTGDFGELPERLQSLYDKVFVPLLPGHGPQGDVKNFTFEKTMDFIRNEFLEIQKEYDTIDLFGVSMGGAIATYLASNYKVNKVVLLAPANNYISPKSGIRRAQYFFHAADEMRPNKRLRDYKMIFPDMIDLLHKMVHNDREALHFVLSIYRDRLSVTTVNTFRLIVKYCNENFKEICCPTLVIWGYLDELVPLRSAELCISHCTNARKELVIIPGVGHMLLRAENMGATVDKIVDFLEE